jgi:hypothetical protein
MLQSAAPADSRMRDPTPKLVSTQLFLVHRLLDFVTSFVLALRAPQHHRQ